MYYLSCLFCTLIPEIHVHPEILCVLQYIDVVHMCNEQLSSFLKSKLSSVKIIDEDR